MCVLGHKVAFHVRERTGEQPQPFVTLTRFESPCLVGTDLALESTVLGQLSVLVCRKVEL